MDLLDELRRVTPPARQSLIEDLFETITLYDVRAVSATSTRRADGRFDVALTVSARKIRADGAGNESEVPLDTWVDLGTLDAAGQVLHLERRLVTTGTSHLTLTVDREPSRAGIDPLGKLIDRDASDNVVPVTH